MRMQTQLQIRDTSVEAPACTCTHVAGSTHAYAGSGRAGSAREAAGGGGSHKGHIKYEHASAVPRAHRWTAGSRCPKPSHGVQMCSTIIVRNNPRAGLLELSQLEQPAWAASDPGSPSKIMPRRCTAVVAPVRSANHLVVPAGHNHNHNHSSQKLSFSFSTPRLSHQPGQPARRAALTSQAPCPPAEPATRHPAPPAARPHRR
jgi:hypothetical protein